MKRSTRYKLGIFFLACILVLTACVFRFQLPEKLFGYYHVFSDRERIESLLASFGVGAPAVFIMLQILQVLFAPIPGEATGFIGGYLFGAAWGFVYSSIGLTAGSWINFLIGRFFGVRYVRKWIPADQFDRWNAAIRRQGILVVFILFVLPGFPKDLLSLFLGLSTLPTKVFVLIAAIGRMPGTLMLSMQGALLFDRLYGLFALMLSLCFIIALGGYGYREKIYSWVDRLNSR